MGKTPRRVMAQFDQGQKIAMACVNYSTQLADRDLASMVAAAQKALNLYFAPVWSQTATLQVVSSRGIPKGRVAPDKLWCCAFWDDADTPSVLGYHDLTEFGYPLSHVFVGPILAGKESVSATFTHELWEMLVDPGIQMWATNFEDEKNYAYEAADAVEETSFLVDGVAISNFLYPAWFESFRKPKSTKFDHLGLCTKPFQILKGGYSFVQSQGVDDQVFGSRAKAARFAKEDRRMHRSQYRPLMPQRPTKPK